MTTNLLNGKIYIGQHQGDKFDKRYYGTGKLIKKYLKKYGKENFKVEILYWAKTIKRLNEAEKVFIEIHNATNRKIGYNISIGGPAFMRGKTLSEETKRKIGEKLKGHKLSDKAKEKLRNANLGKIMSQETKDKISIAKKGHTIVTEETKRKMSIARKGIPRSEEMKRKMSISKKGQHFSDEHRLHLSIAHKGIPISEETKRKRRESEKGHILSKEHKMKISLSLKKYWDKKHISTFDGGE